MSVTPISARCRRCAGAFHLFEVRDQRRGTCPRCSWMLTPDWTAKLLEEAARADTAQRQLVGALRNLRNLPGNVAVQPHSVLRNLFEEVGWQDDLVDDDMVHEELRELRRLVDRWERLAARPAAVREVRPGRFRRALGVFTGRPARSVTVGA